MASEKTKAVSVLIMNTVAFTVCFACWMMNGVLVTFLVDNKVFSFDKAQMGWLIGIPVLTGSIVRLPVGVLTDRYGGRVVYPGVMLVSAVAVFAMSYANSYSDFILGSLGFGLAGTSFAVGIAYTSVWFRKEQQGTALGIFGAGNAGAAVTSVGAPILLAHLTSGGANLDGWRNLPKIYAAALVVMTVIFLLFTHSRKVEHGSTRSLREQLAPLRVVRVWRFGLYYFLVFGGFVALAQWLIPYYVNVYALSVGMAGLLAAIFSMPSGVIRALGGWMSDSMGARTVMYWVLASCAIGSLLLIVPRMEITSPGEGMMALAKGTVTSVSADRVVVGDREYRLRTRPAVTVPTDNDTLIWPKSSFWQEPAVGVGDKIVKKQVVARGTTHIFFQANIWVFTALVFVIGIAMGIGKAAVYKYIPEYFPKDVGVVGGIVGVIGGLGGFICPIIFGYLLRGTGLWTTCWMFFFVLSLACIVWMSFVVRNMIRREAPNLAEQFESPSTNGRRYEVPVPGVPRPLVREDVG